MIRQEMPVHKYNQRVWWSFRAYQTLTSLSDNQSHRSAHQTTPDILSDTFRQISRLSISDNQIQSISRPLRWLHLDIEGCWTRTREKRNKEHLPCSRSDTRWWKIRRERLDTESVPQLCARLRLIFSFDFAMPILAPHNQFVFLRLFGTQSDTMALKLVGQFIADVFRVFILADNFRKGSFVIHLQTSAFPFFSEENTVWIIRRCSRSSHSILPCKNDETLNSWNIPRETHDTKLGGNNLFVRAAVPLYRSGTSAGSGTAFCSLFWFFAKQKPGNFDFN